jgi:hypothetical protein
MTIYANEPEVRQVNFDTLGLVSFYVDDAKESSASSTSPGPADAPVLVERRGVAQVGDQVSHAWAFVWWSG